MGTIVIKDEIMGAPLSRANSRNEINRISFSELNIISVTDFISRRVEMEYARLIDERAEESLEQARWKDVTPTEITDDWLWRHYNQSRSQTKQNKLPTLEEAIETALKGFELRKYVIFFDDRQISDLNDTFSLTDLREALFLRLTPLQGG